MVLVCLLSDALLQHLPSYLGFSYLGRGVSLHGYFSKAQALLLTLVGGVSSHGHLSWPWTWSSSSLPPCTPQQLLLCQSPCQPNSFFLKLINVFATLFFLYQLYSCFFLNNHTGWHILTWKIVSSMRLFFSPRFIKILCSPHLCPQPSILTVFNEFLLNAWQEVRISMKEKVDSGSWEISVPILRKKNHVQVSLIVD